MDPFIYVTEMDSLKASEKTNIVENIVGRGGAAVSLFQVFYSVVFNEQHFMSIWHYPFKYLLFVYDFSFLYSQAMNWVWS